nr:copia protein [Tanacetum cinerariifolium]
TMQHVNTEILKENKNLRTELKELKAITETWFNSSNKVNWCISEQIPSQKKRILGVDQLTKVPSSSGQKDLVFVKSLANDTKVTIPGVERPWLPEAEGFILPNHDTSRILPVELQRNTTDPSVANSAVTDYDLADESLVCSTLLPPLKKLDAPAKGNKSSSASKVHSAPVGKLKSVKIKDDHPLAICDIRQPIWYLDSGCSRRMTGVKSYLYKYVEQSGPKVVFRYNSTCTTEGYGSIKCNCIVSTKVAFVNGLKYNLISISQLCDANYIIQFDEKSGTIFNSNKEVVMIILRVRDAYVLDMTSSAQESCFFVKAFRVFNTRRQQTKETYHITFNENLDVIKFSKTSVNNINIAETERYPPDEYLHPYKPSQRNKRDETGIVIKNKARLVAQGYNQQEGIDYDETFAPAARLEAIKIVLAFSTYMNFIFYQIDVKSAFLKCKLKEEVYVKQPPGFESNEFPNHICKLDKYLYGLKQDPRA